jgi:hypothetical protein
MALEIQDTKYRVAEKILLHRKRVSVYVVAALAVAIIGIVIANVAIVWSVI